MECKGKERKEKLNRMKLKYILRFPWKEVEAENIVIKKSSPRRFVV